MCIAVVELAGRSSGQKLNHHYRRAVKKAKEGEEERAKKRKKKFNHHYHSSIHVLVGSATYMNFSSLCNRDF